MLAFADINVYNDSIFHYSLSFFKKKIWLTFEILKKKNGIKSVYYESSFNIQLLPKVSIVSYKAGHIKGWPRNSMKPVAGCNGS